MSSLVQWESFSSGRNLWNAWLSGFVVLYTATRKYAELARPWHTFDFIFCLANPIYLLGTDPFSARRCHDHGFWSYKRP